MPGGPHPHDDMASPVDLGIDEEEEAPIDVLGWLSGVIALTTLFLFLFNASALHGWAAELPPNAVNARIVVAAGQWETFTDALGLGTPRAWLHARWKAAEGATFPSGA